MSRDTQTLEIADNPAWAPRVQDNSMRGLTLFDSCHQRYTSRYGDASLRGEFRVYDGGGEHNHDGWMSIHLEEVTRDKIGRVSSRVISVTLSKENADRIADMIRGPK